MSDRGKWLLFFYTVPSRPVNARMKIWRKLAKAGAVQLKSAVYVLPNNEENYELCQWLVSEVASMKGEGAFVSVDKIETMKDQEIVDLFNGRVEREYRTIAEKIEELERKAGSIRKGSGGQSGNKLLEQLNKNLRAFEDVRKTDYFSSKAGTALQKKIEALQREIKGLSATEVKKFSEVVSCRIEEYQGRTWATRRRPFVDRMASGWFIKRFIDKEAVFKFIDESDLETLDENTVAFDIRGGAFTHVGDFCTFEALVRAFGIKDRAVKKIAEIVHELDMKDEKFKNTGASGIEDILTGIKTTAKNDAEILEKGMAVFEMLYASKT